MVRAAPNNISLGSYPPLRTLAGFLLADPPTITGLCNAAKPSYTYRKNWTGHALRTVIRKHDGFLLHKYCQHTGLTGSVYGTINTVFY